MPYQVCYNWLAESILSSIPADERRKVETAVDRLREGGFATDPLVYRLSNHGDDSDGPYVLRATEVARVVFSVENDVISIRDIINRNFVLRYG